MPRGRKKHQATRDFIADKAANIERFSWALCDLCQKWRKLPPGYAIAEDAPWYCRINPDPKYNSCHFPEEVWVADTEEAPRIARNSGGRGRRPKVSNTHKQLNANILGQETAPSSSFRKKKYLTASINSDLQTRKKVKRERDFLEPAKTFANLGEELQAILSSCKEILDNFGSCPDGEALASSSPGNGQLSLSFPKWFWYGLSHFVPRAHCFALKAYNTYTALECLLQQRQQQLKDLGSEPDGEKMLEEEQTSGPALGKMSLSVTEPASTEGTEVLKNDNEKKSLDDEEAGTASAPPAFLDDKDALLGSASAKEDEESGPPPGALAEAKRENDAIFEVVQSEGDGNVASKTLHLAMQADNGDGDLMGGAETGREKDAPLDDATDDEGEGAPSSRQRDPGQEGSVLCSVSMSPADEPGALDVECCNGSGSPGGSDARPCQELSQAAMYLRLVILLAVTELQPKAEKALRKYTSGVESAGKTSLSMPLGATTFAQPAGAAAPARNATGLPGQHPSLSLSAPRGSSSWAGSSVPLRSTRLSRSGDALPATDDLDQGDLPSPGSAGLPATRSPAAGRGFGSPVAQRPLALGSDNRLTSALAASYPASPYRGAARKTEAPAQQTGGNPPPDLQQRQRHQQGETARLAVSGGAMVSGAPVVAQTHVNGGYGLVVQPSGDLSPYDGLPGRDGAAPAAATAAVPIVGAGGLSVPGPWSQEYIPVISAPRDRRPAPTSASVSLSDVSDPSRGGMNPWDSARDFRGMGLPDHAPSQMTVQGPAAGEGMEAGGRPAAAEEAVGGWPSNALPGAGGGGGGAPSPQAMPAAAQNGYGYAGGFGATGGVWPAGGRGPEGPGHPAAAGRHATGPGAGGGGRGRKPGPKPKVPGERTGIRGRPPGSGKRQMAAAAAAAAAISGPASFSPPSQSILAPGGASSAQKLAGGYNNNPSGMANDGFSPNQGGAGRVDLSPAGGGQSNGGGGCWAVPQSVGNFSAAGAYAFQAQPFAQAVGAADPNVIQGLPHQAQDASLFPGQGGNPAAQEEMAGGHFAGGAALQNAYFQQMRQQMYYQQQQQHQQQQYDQQQQQLLQLHLSPPQLAALQSAAAALNGSAVKPGGSDGGAEGSADGHSGLNLLQNLDLDLLAKLNNFLVCANNTQQRQQQ